MISPGQVDRLQDELDKYTSAIIVGCLFFFVGATLGIFASQEFATGTDFMQRLSGGTERQGLAHSGGLDQSQIDQSCAWPPRSAAACNTNNCRRRRTLEQQKDRQADEVHQLLVGANYT